MSMSEHNLWSLLESDVGFDSPATSEYIITIVCNNRGGEPRNIPQAEVTSSRYFILSNIAYNVVCNVVCQSASDSRFGLDI